MNFHRSLLILLLGLICFSTLAFAEGDWTILTTMPDYQPAKLEPEKGLYLGAYVLQDERIGGDMTLFNRMTGKRHATFFRYVGYGRPFPSEWVEEVKALGAIPHIALEPNGGLHAVHDNHYLRTFAQAAGAADTPLFLRFASEMNGDWTAYSGDPEAFVTTWRMVHDVFEEEAPQVAMLWTVFTFPESTMDAYYPGDDVVDWVGVNLYNVAYHNDRIDHDAKEEDPLRLLDEVYLRYSHKKPIQIAEYGATNYSRTDGQDHRHLAVEKIQRLYGELPKRYPRVKAVNYFNVNNLVNAPRDRQINNYALTEKAEVLTAYATLIRSRHFLSQIIPATESFDETFSFNHRLFERAGALYVDIDFFTRQLGLEVLSLGGHEITLSDGHRSLALPLVYTRKDRSFYNQRLTVRGLPLRRVAEHFGYRLDVNSGDRTIRLLKE